ncbi:MAG: DUF1573 domain-containing protein, partial [Ginsengibacter sp.]
EYATFKTLFVSLKFVQNVLMKIIYTTICGLTCFFSATTAQTNVKPAPVVINTQIPTEQNIEGKKEIASIPKTSASNDVITLKETEFDFGKIPHGKPVTHVFLFTNTGNTQVSLQNVQASCGCTTPEWSKDAVAPGETSKITVGYNAASMGIFTKTITITYNDNQSKQLIIKGEVWQTPSASAPENPALETLKNQQ